MISVTVKLLAKMEIISTKITLKNANVLKIYHVKPVMKMLSVYHVIMIKDIINSRKLILMIMA